MRIATLPLARRLGTFGGGFIAREGALLREVGALFAGSRLLLLAATLLAGLVRHPSVLPAPLASPLWRTWDQWDARIYAHIAVAGYLPADIHQTPAFFPLFPLLERLTAPLVGGDPALAGLMLANVAWFAALIELYLLARADLGVATARGAVLALSVFPTAMFGAVGYPEALFLALAVASFRRMRAGRWGWAAALGLLAGLTRQAGIVLILPFLWEYAAQHGWQWRRTRADILLALAFPAGLALYAFWLRTTVGDPLAFWHAQATWYRTSAWPWQTLLWGLVAVGREPSAYFTFRAAQEWLTAVAMIALAAWGRRRMPGSYSAYAFPLLALFLMAPSVRWPLLSQSRFDLELFPVFVVLGAWIGAARWRGPAVVALCLPMQLAFMAVFARHGWMI